MEFEETPTKKLTTEKLFGFASDMKLLGFAKPHALTPAIDDTYHFDPATSQAILAGFTHNRRVLVQGYHGTGKSTHIEQIAARLNWPCIRINMDSHISRTDLIGRDAIVLQEGKQVTAFQEGIIPWSLRRPIALVFDEYDAGRPDVMFVIQRILEAQGKLTLLDQNTVITPHPYFRIFATSNTIGLGDASGLYHGTQPINQGQMDRWNIVATLNYLDAAVEEKIILAKIPALNNAKGKKLISQMVAMADLSRQGFMNGDISTVMSPRTVLSWAENVQILGNVDTAFRLSFLNKCDEMERPTIAEYYQRCFDVDLYENAA
jgi:cobaltochelatase CobS